VQVSGASSIPSWGRRRWFLEFAVAALALSSAACSGSSSRHESSSGGAGGATTSEGLPALHVDGRWLKDPVGNSVVLRGVASADLKDVAVDRAPMDLDGLIDLVSDAKRGWYARVIRLTVFPERWLEDPDAYLANYLEPAVDRALERGLYAIIDWHEISDSSPVAERVAAFWRLVAPRFARRSHVLYEVFNEPQNVDDFSWSHWKADAQPWVDEIRRSAPDTILLLGAPFWDQQLAGAVSDPFSGENLAYVAHVYPGIDPSVWSAGGPISQVSALHPVIITEWGYESGGEIPTDGTQAGFGDPFKSFVESQRIGWIAWCADTIWGPPIFDMNWEPRTGPNVMGEFARAWLYEKRNADRPTGL
jgi:hypothetical protein